MYIVSSAYLGNYTTCMYVLVWAMSIYVSSYLCSTRY